MMNWFWFENGVPLWAIILWIVFVGTLVAFFILDKCTRKK